MKTKYSVLEALKSKEVTDAAEKIGRLVSEKRRLEERIKVSRDLHPVCHLAVSILLIK